MSDQYVNSRPPGCRLRLEVGSYEASWRQPTCWIGAGYNSAPTAPQACAYTHANTPQSERIAACIFYEYRNYWLCSEGTPVKDIGSSIKWRELQTTVLKKTGKRRMKIARLRTVGQNQNLTFGLAGGYDSNKQKQWVSIDYQEAETVYSLPSLVTLTKEKPSFLSSDLTVLVIIDDLRCGYEKYDE